MTQNNFFSRSKIVANDFIQSVIFIDDEAFIKKGLSENDLDAVAISRSFAKSQKICALYNPQYESEINDLVFIAKKADITILDWRMNFKKVVEDISEEEDEEDIDPRGKHTLNILKQVLKDEDSYEDGLKLILIYTGETDLRAIADEIEKHLDKKVWNRNNDFEIASEYRKIIVIGKPSLATKLTYTKQLLSQVVKYDDLSEYVIVEFTKMTSGLVSNMAIDAITSLRKNTSKILKIYNKNVDPAYLAHRALLQIPDDAGDLIKESLVSTFSAIIDYADVLRHCSYAPIKDWIGYQKFSEKTFSVKKNSVKITKIELRNWQSRGMFNAIKDACVKQHPKIPIADSLIDSVIRDKKDALEYFTPDSLTLVNSNEDFSILTHHKSNYATLNYIPKLTLGTVIRGVRTNTYWICIQQKCDSVRIVGNESRKFLFLPLEKIDGDKKFNFLALVEGNYLKLKINFNTHQLRTIKFNATLNEMVTARKFGSNRKNIFIPVYNKKHIKYDNSFDENFEWIMDLKDGHAQRVANHFSSQLSRVGLDESEWLRRWSN